MRLYITGGTGLVGGNIIRLARERGDIEIIAAQYGPPPEWEVDYELDPLDMADTDAARESIRRYRPDVVIHCAAILDHPYMDANRAAAWQATVEGNLAFAPPIGSSTGGSRWWMKIRRQCPCSTTAS